MQMHPSITRVAGTLAATVLLATLTGCATCEQPAVAGARSSGDTLPPVVTNHPGPHQISVLLPPPDGHGLHATGPGQEKRVKLRIKIVADPAHKHHYRVIHRWVEDEDVP